MATTDPLDFDAVISFVRSFPPVSCRFHMTAATLERIVSEPAVVVNTPGVGFDGVEVRLNPAMPPNAVAVEKTDGSLEMIYLDRRPTGPDASN